METPSLTRRSALLAGAALGAASLTGCGQDARILRSADAHPPNYPTVLGVKEFARLLKERSNGELQLKVYPGAQLGGEEDTLEITIFGGLDMNRVSISPLGSIVPETRIPTLPFLFRSTAHFRAALDGAPGRAILDAFEPHGMVGLCYYDSGARSFYTRDRLINSPEDLKGQKIRVQNSDLFVSMVEALGGDATPMSYGEIYQAILQGVIDGAENNWPSYESSRHFEAAPFYSLTRHVMAPEVFLMSKKRWDKLDREAQDLIRLCARDSVPFMRQKWDERSAISEQRVLEAGVEVITPELAPFVERVQPVWEKYLTEPHMRKLADDILAVEVPDA
ncbi:TRAP transporter substrate-binding protein [Parvularcula sp. LCG005]|uniref:TRAP transporter substrate-binding protein n=1 Tax=Parvularcula sp. LCG005 TaxID=3078805 RepID=UPI0029435E50|nr:TRAP transporter substrate-binding protein [Parvularcula sp. LCG005]WOI53473.1 TRAP transporter substrate-binding protein [Parvularcula sp. LCG005]